VLDRAGLEARACECYGVVKGEFDRLLPHLRQTEAVSEGVLGHLEGPGRVGQVPVNFLRRHVGHAVEAHLRRDLDAGDPLKSGHVLTLSGGRTSTDNRFVIGKLA